MTPGMQDALGIDAARRGLSALFGALDTALQDAELLSRIPAAFEDAPESGQEQLLAALLELHGWRAAAWWSLDRGRARLRAAAGEAGPRPHPRPGVGPLGSSLQHGVERTARATEAEDCPRLRRAARRGSDLAVVLVGSAEGREGRLELLGPASGAPSAERLALLRHVAWVLALLDGRAGA